MEKFFHLKEHGTTVKTEVIAGITTFLAMAYILAVNPSMLGAAGMNTAGVFVATALSAAFAGPFSCGLPVPAFRNCRNDAPAVASLDGGSSGRLWLHCVDLYRAPVETADAMHCGIGGTAVHAVCFLLSRSLFTVRGRNRLDTGRFFFFFIFILHPVQIWCTIKTMNNEIQISHFFNHSGVCHPAGFLDGAGTGTENDR